MKITKLLSLLGALIILASLVTSCFESSQGAVETTEPELTLGELPDYSDAHAEDTLYIAFSSDLEPISEERFKTVRQSLYNMLYQSDIDFQIELLKDSDLDRDALLQKADQVAQPYQSLYKVILMNPDNLLYDDYYTRVCNFVSRYYGTVNGCEIICVSTFIDRETAYELGGVKIESTNPFYIFACKEKEFIPLADAYEKGWLTPVDLLLISKRNRDFNAWWEENDTHDLSAHTYVKYIPELEDLSDEMIAEIYDHLYSDVWEGSYSSMVSYLQTTYGEHISAEKLEAQAAFNAEMQERSAEYYFFRYPNSHSVGWRYYGIIGGYAVFAEVATTENVKHYNLGEYEIRFANGAEMWIYSSEQGKVELEEAYKSGLLTDADVAKISERHEAYENYIFKK